MTAFTTITYLILSFIQFIIMLRFICQANNVNYYNPVTQSIIKLSGYIFKPIEFLGINLNTYILFFIVYIFTFFKLYVPLLVNNQIYPLIDLSVVTFAYLLKDFINIYWYLVIISAVKSWFNIFVGHPIFSLIDELCDPLFRAVRAYIPSVSGIDFSPIIILFLLQLTEIIFIPRIFNLTSLI